MLGSLFVDTKISNLEINNKYINNLDLKSYFDKIEKQIVEEIDILKKQPIKDEFSFIKYNIYKYVELIINLVEKQYGSYIKEDRMKRLKTLLDINNIIVVDEINSKQLEFKNGQLVINYDLLKGTSIYEKTARLLRAVPHSLFHILIDLTKKNNDLKKMVVKLIDGEEIDLSGKFGFMFTEGLVEKYSTEFCMKNNLPYNVIPKYICYVQVCNYIISKNPSIKTKVFKMDYNDVLNLLSDEEKELYTKEEILSYAVKYENFDLDIIKNTTIVKVSSFVSEDESKALKLSKGNEYLKELLLTCFKKNIEIISSSVGPNQCIRFAYTDSNLIYICKLLHELNNHEYDFKYCKCEESYFEICNRTGTEMFGKLRTILKNTFRTEGVKMSPDLHRFIELSYEIEKDEFLEIKSENDYFYLGYCKNHTTHNYYIITHDSYYNKVALKAGFKTVDDSFYETNILSSESREGAFKVLNSLFTHVKLYLKGNEEFEKIA